MIKPKYRKLEFESKIFIFIWSNTLILISFFLKILSRIQPKLKLLLKSNIDQRVIDEIKEERDQKKNSFLFFCSSAGEYEQALPLISRLKKNEENYIQIIFFSPSGENFAKKRKEETPFFLSPLDTQKNWNPLFAAIRPQYIFVIRHEIWPVFLTTSWKWGKTILVNASFTEKTRQSFFNLKLKKFLFRFFDVVDFVHENDYTFYKNYLPQTQQKITNFGDTKYDRVLERAIINKQNVVHLKEDLEQLFPNKKRLIIGSAWPQDTEIVLKAFAVFKKKYNNWQIMVALHELKKNYFEHTENLCKSLNLKYIYFTQLEKLNDQTHFDVIIIDRIGILGELYGCGHAAYVGGANHHRVHNVLEPAAYGLNISFGPKYFTSSEAVSMISENYAIVAQNKNELLEWMTKIEINPIEFKNPLEFIKKNIGATDKILKNI